MVILVVAPFMRDAAWWGSCCVAIAAGSFLAVDWALMTDIIPKAASGRLHGDEQRGDRVGRAGGADRRRAAADASCPGRGPAGGDGGGRAVLPIGALLLRPVDPRRREDEDEAPMAAVPVTAATA